MTLGHAIQANKNVMVVDMGGGTVVRNAGVPAYEAIRITKDQSRILLRIKSNP